jgi:dTMP kinase
MILDGAAQDISKHTYAYLFAADREEHMRRVVIPALEEDKWVVSDRSVISDFAYRPTHGNHVRRRHLKQFNDLDPMVFYVDVDTDTCIERMTSRGNLNEFEKAHVINKIDDLKRGYEKVALAKMWNPFFRIHNNNTIESAFDKILPAVRWKYGLKDETAMSGL